jgi:molybdate transport system substrate-binding protein
MEVDMSADRVKAFFAMAVFFFSIQSASARAAELRVLSAAALNPVTNVLFAEFERATGHKLAVRAATGPILSKEIEAGAPFDVAILSLDVDALIKSGKIAPGTRTALVRTGVGVGIKKGEPKPDISTVDAFKIALLNAKSVAYARQGSSGLYFLSLLDRLGIAADMKAKLKPQDGDNPVDAIASGEAEMTVVGVALILLQPGAELVGPIPSELQNYVLFTGGVSAASKEGDAGRALLKFLTTAAAQTAFKAKGFEAAVQ